MDEDPVELSVSTTAIFMVVVGVGGFFLLLLLIISEKVEDDVQLRDVIVDKPDTDIKSVIGYSAVG